MPDPAQGANANTADPQVFYVHADHLNTPRVVTDKTGAPRWRWLAEPFGTSAPETSPAGAPVFAFNLRFPGQFFDAESGMFYNYQRDYIPGVGRYAQSDPIGLDGGINTYSYVGADPLNFVDPEGLAPDGHHWVIGPIRHDPNLSPEARQVFRDSKTGYYGERHGWDKAHSDYNKGVQDLWNSKKFDPSNMTKGQAQDFVRDVMRSNDPRVSSYRRTIINQCMNYGMRRGGWTRGGSEQ
jgi:RHS repeat-associated protein